MALRALGCGAACILLLSACLPQTSAGTAAPTPTNLPLALPTPSLPASPTPEDRELTICAGTEPADLFLYSEPTYSQRAVLSAIYDGPVDMRDYVHQPVLLQKIPSILDGDAFLEEVLVQEGSLVMDAAGGLTRLAPGTVVWPAGCTSPDCALTYPGGSLAMTRMRVLFNLKPGVEWADGTPLTAADSVFSYRVALSQDVLYSHAGLASGSARTFTFTSEYSALDSNTVQWTGMPGFLDPDYQLAFFSPLPEHQLSGYAIPDLLQANEVLYSPLGWGPYQVAGWVPGERLTLEPNPHYSPSAGAGLYFERVQFLFIGQEASANLARLEQGECDLLLQDATSGASGPDLQALVASGAAQLFLDPGNAAEVLSFNLSPSDPFAPAFFAERGMRQAAARCIDRQALADSNYAGLVPVLDQALPSDHPLLVGAPSGEYAYDPGAAAALLTDLGWIDVNADGIREASSAAGFTDGQPLAITLAIPVSPLREGAGALLTAQLTACGFQVQLFEAPGRDLLAQDPQALISGRRFDLAELSVPLGIATPCQLGRSSGISAAANGWSGTNLSGFSDPDFDAACRFAEASLPGTAEYTPAWQTVLALYYHELPELPLFVQTGFTLARPDLAGVTTGWGQNELQQIEDFHLEP